MMNSRAGSAALARSRLRLASVSCCLATAAVLVSGCGIDYSFSASRPSSWPVTSGEAPEETRAKREAEAQKYLAGQADPNWPKMVAVLRDRPEAEAKKGEPKKEESTKEELKPPVEPQPQGRAEPQPQARAEEPRTAPPPAVASSEAARYGDLLFISAQLPVDAQGKPLPPETRVEQQAELVLEKLDAVLGANRLTMANVVSITVYLTDLEDLAAFDTVAPRFFRRGMPPRSVVGVARLPDGAKVQVSAVAGR